MWYNGSNDMRQNGLLVAAPFHLTNRRNMLQMATSKYTPKDIARFWSKVNTTSNSDECWEWQASKDIHGYGWFFHDNKMKKANRTAWELCNGMIPNDLNILHTCDNPSCCNPKHLFAGTRQDNMRDMVAKGRNKFPHLVGEQHGKHKLTFGQVNYIRERYARGNITQRVIANEVGISQSQVGRIIRGTRWKIVEGKTNE